ncbi:hypothetical protein M5D96_003691 [Drosophila gunungcola]|uniref:Uncharacterized protein n=1 Tax=Drosophila gunungcola TaxID=103775 RepID=A0A9Q0BSP1_9MUSC|nr:hypothetical protein M5D96_003691 [Drosophila gunungcola]
MFTFNFRGKENILFQRLHGDFLTLGCMYAQYISKLT